MNLGYNLKKRVLGSTQGSLTAWKEMKNNNIVRFINNLGAKRYFWFLFLKFVFSSQKQGNRENKFSSQFFFSKTQRILNSENENTKMIFSVFSKTFLENKFQK